MKNFVLYIPQWNILEKIFLKVEKVSLLSRLALSLQSSSFYPLNSGITSKRHNWARKNIWKVKKKSMCTLIIAKRTQRSYIAVITLLSAVTSALQKQLKAWNVILTQFERDFRSSWYREWLHAWGWECMAAAVHIMANQEVESKGQTQTLCSLQRLVKWPTSVSVASQHKGSTVS